MTAAPGWPETIIDLTARTITLGAVTRPLTGLDVEAEILPLLAAQATDHGHPVRATFTAADGWTRRMIVTADGHLHPSNRGESR